MSALTQTTIVFAFLALFIGIALGYFFGSQTSRKQRRDLQHDLNRQGLKVLETKSELNKLEKSRDQFNRKDRLLKLTLKKLADLKKETEQYDEQIEHQSRQNYLQASRLQVAAAEARQQARRAANAAALATNQLEQLKKLSNTTQNIRATKTKPSVQGAAVKVTLVDQHSTTVSKESVSRASIRDSVR